MNLKQQTYKLVVVRSLSDTKFEVSPTSVLFTESFGKYEANSHYLYY
jgi:hypothetical protein